MSDDWELHLSLELLKELAYGTLMLDSVQRHHFQNCEECRDTWWVFKNDADVIQRARDVARKTRQTIDRLGTSTKRR
jgi:hypothetical protein